MVNTSSKSVIIDPGHGGTDPGAIGFGVREKDWNLRISLYQYERLKELGANVAITRTNDKTLNSGPRTNLIKGKYDIAISNHWNAFNGSARGIETIHSIHGGKSLATSIADGLVKVTGIPLRRVFSRKNSRGGDYYFMHRLTGSTTTVIIEYGFIDNATDHRWYKNDTNFYKAAEAVIEAICKELGITYKAKGSVSKPNNTDKTINGKLFKVQVGAFKDVKNAEGLHNKIEDKGLDAFVVQEGGLYKVQAGAYSDIKNAEAQLARVKKITGEGFIVSEGTTKPLPTPKPKPTPKPTPKKSKWNYKGGKWIGQVLREGDYGPQVKQMQEMLAKQYFYPEKGAKNNGIDSYYGAKTKNAVERFQLIKGLEVDGIAGRDTYNKAK